MEKSVEDEEDEFYDRTSAKKQEVVAKKKGIFGKNIEAGGVSRW